MYVYIYIYIYLFVRRTKKHNGCVDAHVSFNYLVFFYYDMFFFLNTIPRPDFKLFQKHFMYYKYLSHLYFCFYSYLSKLYYTSLKILRARKRHTRDTYTSVCSFLCLFVCVYFFFELKLNERSSFLLPRIA